jgi:hypothetical protein
MAEIKDTPDRLNVARAIACNAQAATRIGALVASALHNETPMNAGAPYDARASRSNPVREAPTATTSPTARDPSTVRGEGGRGQRHGGQPEAKLD